MEKIHLTKDTLYGKPHELKELDKICAIIVRVRKLKNVEESKNKLIAVLEDLLADESYQKKKQKLIEKHGFIMNKKLERRVNQMCNISDYVIECAVEEGYIKGIGEGIEQGIEQDLRNSIAVLRLVGSPDEEIKEVIMKQYKMSEEKVQLYMHN